MAILDLERFSRRDEQEKIVLKPILELEKDIAPAVKRRDVIDFEISSNALENDDITGKYEIYVVEKDDESVELGIVELESEYDDIILFSELSLLLDSKLIKVLIYAINMGIIANAINKMNSDLWSKGKRIEDDYL
ncbi:hypothetical protein DSECCO2_311840 [anaerobic digester metagenome]